MSNWALDGLIELIQKFNHKMNFKNDSLEGWMQHSAHLQLNNKCIRLAMTEYQRVFNEQGRRNKFGDGNENDYDPGRNRKSTSVPRRAQEHKAIAEFFNINKFAVERPGRKYDRDKLIASLKELKTELSPESEADKSQRWMNEVISPDEQAVSELTDELFTGYVI